MNVFPSNYLQDSLNSYIYKHTTPRSQIIYITVLLALFAAAADIC